VPSNQLHVLDFHTPYNGKVLGNILGSIPHLKAAMIMRCMMENYAYPGCTRASGPIHGFCM
jgi:hypothetical protein